MCIEKLFLRWDNDHLLIAKNFVKIKQKYNARYFLYLFYILSTSTHGMHTRKKCNNKIVQFSLIKLIMGLLISVQQINQIIEHINIFFNFFSSSWIKLKKMVFIF